MFPERFMYRDNKVHASEVLPAQAGVCRVERDAVVRGARRDRFRHAGRRIAEDINKHTRAPHGHASVRDVQRKKLEDHQPSFFLAEACKYLYLLFDAAGSPEKRNVAFSTGGTRVPIFLARDDARNAENDHGEAGPSKTAYTSLEFVEMVRGVVAEAYDRRRRRRNLAGTSRGPVVPALGGKWDAAVASLRVAARWPDPSAALHGSQHNGAGWGATERLCPNLAVVGTAVRGRRVLDGGERPRGGGGRDGKQRIGNARVGGGGGGGGAQRGRGGRLAALAAQVEALRAAMMQEKAKLAEARRDEEADGESDSGSGSGSGSGSSAREKTPRAEKIRERRKEDVAARAGKGPPGKKARSAGQAPRPSRAPAHPRPRRRWGERVREDETERVPRVGPEGGPRVLARSGLRRGRGDVREAKVLHPRFLWVSAPESIVYTYYRLVYGEIETVTFPRARETSSRADPPTLGNSSPRTPRPAPSNFAALSLAFRSAATAMLSFRICSSFFACDASVATARLHSLDAPLRLLGSPRRVLERRLRLLPRGEVLARLVVVPGLHRRGGEVVERRPPPRGPTASSGCP